MVNEAGRHLGMVNAEAFVRSEAERIQPDTLNSHRQEKPHNRPEYRMLKDRNACRSVQHGRIPLNASKNPLDFQLDHSKKGFTENLGTHF